MKDRDSITGVILVGGQGSRLQRRDKGLIEFNGRPLIEQTLEQLRPQVDEILVSANRNLEFYRGYGEEVISDALSGFQGPLAGIAAALRAARTPWIQVAPGDAPRLPLDLVERLSGALRESNARMAVPFDGARLQPVHGLLHRDLSESLDAYLAGGDRKVMLWVDNQSPVRVDFSAMPELFETVNTPQQYARLQAGVGS